MTAALPGKNGKNVTNGMMSLGQTERSQHGNPKHWMNGKKNTMRDDEDGDYQGKSQKGKSKTKKEGVRKDSKWSAGRMTPDCL